MGKESFLQFCNTKTAGNFDSDMGKKFRESIIRIDRLGCLIDIINDPFGITSGAVPCCNSQAIINCPSNLRRKKYMFIKKLIKK